MSVQHPVNLLDITTGLTRKLIEYLQAVADDLADPPERDSIFPNNFKFEFSRIHVSVQLSEQRFDYDMARQRERDHIVGFLDEKKDVERYKLRSIEAYEKQAARPVVRDWEEVRGNIHDPTLKRAIILGDPGFGKSWLLRFDGWRLATTEIGRFKHSQVGSAAVQIPIFARLSDLAALKGPLLARLRAVLCDGDLDLPHVAETDEQAWREAVPQLARFWQLAGDNFWRGDSLTADDLPRLTERYVYYPGGLTANRLDEWGTSLIGSPETVTKKARMMIETARPDCLVGMFSFGGLSHEQVSRSIELFGTKVIPALKNECAAF